MKLPLGWTGRQQQKQEEEEVNIGGQEAEFPSDCYLVFHYSIGIDWLVCMGGESGAG